MTGLDTAASATLRSINHLFERKYVELTERVHVAVGYGVSTFSFVIGDTGVIAVDSGSIPEMSAAAIADLRTRTDLPILGLVYTHGHPDHTGGADAFLEENPDIEIWGNAKFGDEARNFARNGAAIAKERGKRQAGFLLPPEMRINNGIAPAIYPKTGALAGGPGGGPDPRTLPNHTFDTDATIELGGVTLEVSYNPGETDDQILTWFPDDKVAFSGDNMYRSFPNFYAIRGTQYRDVRDWCESIDRIGAKQAEHLVLGHTTPFSGADEVAEAVDVYSRALWHVYNETIAGMNAGKTPDELAHEVTLPPELADNEMLGEYYGNVSFGVRSIFTGVLGWFDGNPTKMNPLHPADRAAKVAELAGGAEALFERAQAALSDGDAQWCAELCDMVIAVDHRTVEATHLKADAVDELGYNLVTATGRNYLHTCAQQMREAVADA
ncbi:MAG: alkyl/aryl-sulfatase [Acidimicrobiales bacterium]|nr:MAG: alkyl/aryl-sulfatase [Acidimicrobiales bacterium]